MQVEENRFGMTKSCAIPSLISRKQSDLGETDTSVPRFHSFFVSGRIVRRFFFIYRCLLPKTHAPHHYKIADYSCSRRARVAGAPLSIRFVSIAWSEESKMAVSDRGSAHEEMERSARTNPEEKEKKEKKEGFRLSAE